MNKDRKSRSEGTPWALVLITIAVTITAGAPMMWADQPYPSSPVVMGVTWDPSSALVRLAPGSDNWPMTWADDDHQYSSWGDGGGFGGTDSDGRVSLGVARIEGNATNFAGYNRWGGKNPEYPATFGGKSYGILSVDGVLYMWVGPESGWTSSTESVICWSNDHGATWQQENTWKFLYTDGFSLPTFLTFGKDYQGARDGYIYVYGYDASAGQYGPFNNINLARVPKAQMRNRNAYEFFRGLDSYGNPLWTSNIGQLEPVFVDPAGGVSTISVTYNAGIDRYILCTSHGTEWGQWGIFDAPEPWGPWTTVEYYDSWLNGADTFFYNFSTKWMSPDGLELYLVFTGVGAWDSFNLLRATLILADATAPSIPQNLSTVATSESTIDLDWTASTDSESGIDHYNVYRNGPKVAQSNTTQFSDTGLLESTFYTYRVSAVNGAGLESERSDSSSTATLPDAVPPTIHSVSAVSPTQVDLFFSEGVEESSAENISNYEIDNGIVVYESNLDPDVTTVHLTTGTHAEGIVYTITVNNIRDRAMVPNTIEPNSTGNYQLNPDLEVTTLNKTNYETVMLVEGDEYYVDRTYTVVDIPPEYEGLLWIKTANNDKSNTSEEFLTFTVNQDVTAYVGYDHQISMPYWITDHYLDTGAFIEVSDLGSGSSLEVWSRDLPAGEVVMGGNKASGASGATLMYVVLLRGQGGGVDTTPPLISSVSATDVTDSSVIIQWSTDEPSDSQVEYGLTMAYGSTTPLETSMVTQHGLTLYGLLPGTQYHYRVRSADGSANVAYSGDETFQTHHIDVIPPQIFSIEVSSVSDSGATVSWSTDEPADSQVEYGLTPGSYTWSIVDSLLVQTHSLDLFNLSPGTQYHFHVLSQDVWGNSTASSDSSFVTPEEIPGQPGKPSHYDD